MHFRAETRIAFTSALYNDFMQLRAPLRGKLATEDSLILAKAAAHTLSCARMTTYLKLFKVVRFLKDQDIFILVEDVSLERTKCRTSY